MANEIKLECYTIRIRDKGKENYHNLDNTEGKDFLNVFKDFIKDFDKKLLKSKEVKKSIEFNSGTLRYTSKDRIISGIIESGEYGLGGVIKNIETGKVRLEKKITDSDIKPFYFLLFVPKKLSVGMLVLQRIGGFGVKTVFVQHLKSHLYGALPNSFFDVEALISNKVAKAFIDHGGIKEITFRKFSLPSDIIDAMGLGGYEDEILDLELRFVAKRNRVLPFNSRVKKFMNDPSAKMFNIKELNGLGFNGDHKSTVKISHNGTTRRIDLSDTGQIRPYYDIDNEVEKDINNHPKFNSIDKIARKLVVDLNTEFGT